ncbi:MAG: hypothetical protein CO188_01425 [Zetaproteobacteria bacterium CG_4_9_14_3_um_filter_54_145]|nr:MAG: hypothetical protein CO188_01425 [Zetaproteobacteria bacterium CG_4_9_14_3_um_filter_54_145]
MAMQLEYMHQTGLIDVKEIDRVIEDDLKYAASAAVCITVDPAQCLNMKNRGQSGCAWDKLVVVYRDGSLKRMNDLLSGMEAEGWQGDRCQLGLGDATGKPMQYYACIRLQHGDSGSGH